MVVRPAAPGGLRGGTGIPTTRPPLARLILGLAALGIAAAIAGASLDVRSGGLLFITGGFALGALLVVVSALVFAAPSVVGPAVALLALVYFAHVLIAGESDAGTLALVSVGLLLVGELSQWSIDRRQPGRYVAAISLARASGVVWLTGLATAATLLCLLALGLPVADETWALILATAAAVALIGLIAAVARGFAR